MSAPFARLLPYLLRYKRAFLLGLACVVTTTAIQLLSPWVLKNAIDDLNTGVTREKLAMYAALLLGHRARRRRVPLPHAADPDRRLA